MYKYTRDFDTTLVTFSIRSIQAENENKFFLNSLLRCCLKNTNRSNGMQLLGRLSLSRHVSKCISNVIFMCIFVLSTKVAMHVENMLWSTRMQNHAHELQLKNDVVMLNRNMILFT